MISYIGFYGREDDPSRRLVSRAAVDKMDYIAEKLSVYDEVTIVSASQTTCCKRFFFGRREKIAPRIAVRTFASAGWPYAKLARLELSFKQIQVFLSLMLHCGRKSNVVVYHSLYIMKPVLLAHRLRRFHLILEVEEIYQDVVDIPKRQQAMEFQTFESADAYLFSTESLNLRLNQKNKPHAILYGNYDVAGRCEPTSDGLIHVVFGGNLERSKGALLAAKAAALLPDGFRMHIAGCGPENDMEEIRQAARDAARENAEMLRFEGELDATAYENLLNRCAIGLCSQDPTAKYSETSFPSKVLNYLRHGLKVVSIRIPTISRSAVAPAIVFYDEDTPAALAGAIIEAAKRDAAGAETLARLDGEFERALAGVLTGGKKHE